MPRLRTSRFTVGASLLSLAAALAGCARMLPAPEPMRAVSWRATAGAAAAPAKCLVVFLPGAGDSAEDFEKNGFVAEVQRRRLSVDMVAANATIGYYARGTFPTRAAADVIGPARAAGRYAETWLVGMSMGGFGTLYYSRVHTEQVTGVLALAPYLGDDDVTDEIRAQGGVTGWRAPPRAEALTEDNYQRELWRWLQAVTRGQERGPALYLGYGKEDKLARKDELLAAVLPAGHVFQADGGHKWPVWKVLLARFLDDSDFARRCR